MSNVPEKIVKLQVNRGRWNVTVPVELITEINNARYLAARIDNVCLIYKPVTA